MIRRAERPAVGLLLALLAPASAPAAGAGASALDAWAAYRQAESKCYRLAADRVTSFQCRVRSPFVEKLADPGGPLEGRDIVVMLRWTAPDAPVVRLESGTEGLAEDERDRVQMLFAPLHELVLPVPPSQRLAKHEFRFVATDEDDASGETVIEARARDPQDPRRRARFTLGADGLVRRELGETKEGQVSVFEYAYGTAAGRTVMTACTGTWRGQPIAIEMEWGATVASRPVPTRVVVRQLDAAGAPLPGLLGEMEFRLSDHVVNGARAAGGASAP